MTNKLKTKLLDVTKAIVEAHKITINKNQTKSLPSYEAPKVVNSPVFDSWPGGVEEVPQNSHNPFDKSQDIMDREDEWSRLDVDVDTLPDDYNEASDVFDPEQEDDSPDLGPERGVFTDVDNLPGDTSEYVPMPFFHDDPALELMKQQATKWTKALQDLNDMIAKKENESRN